MVLVLAWDDSDNFVCTMQFKNMYAFDEFNENISFDNPLSFEIIDLSSELDTFTMKFEDTPLYKYLDAREYKVTLADGRIIKSEGWIKRWEDEFNTEHIPHVAKKMEAKKRGR